MFDSYTESLSDGVWTLVGLDTFENEWYPLDGDFTSEAEARLAAATRLDYLDVTQPVESSGGQSGIQDQVWVVRPDSSKFRVW
jgi:hypothetical protein